MAKGDSPHYIVKLPVNGVWHRLRAAWKSKKDDKDSITLVVDVGAALTFQPGPAVVLTEPYEPDASFDKPAA
jgi:hypothetical protein